MDFQSCCDKQRLIQETFLTFSSQEEKYNHVIEMGRTAPPMSPEDQREENLVKGCQSLLYLKLECVDGRLKISTHSDALISAGLAVLLTQVYDGEPPEAVLKCPPLFLKDIGLLNALSPSRANGLKSLYQKLQHEVLQWIE